MRPAPPHASKIKHWRRRRTVRIEKIGIELTHGCGNGVWAAPASEHKALRRVACYRAATSAARPSPDFGSRPIRVTPATAITAARSMSATDAHPTAARACRHACLAAYFLRDDARPPLASFAVRLADSHSPPMGVRRCGRRGLGRNPRCARVLHCVPVPGATQSVAWDASGL
jgi:hypothetical protein